MPFTVKMQDSLIFSYQEAPLPNTLSTSPFNVIHSRLRIHVKIVLIHVLLCPSCHWIAIFGKSNLFALCSDY